MKGLVRDGLNATRLVLPHDPASVAQFPTVMSYLVHRFADDAGRIQEKIRAGEVHDGIGRTITENTPYHARGLVYLFRDLVPEPVVPFDIPVLYHDENIIVVDKPHFLATMPRGAYITRSVVIQLRRSLGIDTITPAHRLDRVTAGVLLLTVRPHARGPYQLLFERRHVRKTYFAVAPIPAGVEFPITVRNRIIKNRGTLTAQIVPGPVNAESRITLIRTDPQTHRGLYRLEPHTGRTHQLRLHMAGLGAPIVNDNFYPKVYDVSQLDYSAPLQLLAHQLEFVDPFTGQERRFVSARHLSGFPQLDGEPFVQGEQR